LAFGFVVATGFYLVKNTPLPAGEGRRGIAAECIPNKGTLTEKGEILQKRYYRLGFIFGLGTVIFKVDLASSIR
jgi:hypothetical protein